MKYEAPIDSTILTVGKRIPFQKRDAASASLKRFKSKETSLQPESAKQ